MRKEDKQMIQKKHLFAEGVLNSHVVHNFRFNFFIFNFYFLILFPFLIYFFRPPQFANLTN